MRKTTKWAIGLVAVLSLNLAACVDPQQVSEMKGKVDELQAQQKDILTKLDELAKGQKEILAKAGTAAAPAKPAGPDPNKKYDIKIGNSFSKGPATAAVTIVEWSDFQCPFCSQAKDLVHQILDAFPNDVRFVFKNYPLPFHQQAMPAAKAAVAAGKQGKFFEMHDKLFENFKSLAADKYEVWAGELGLNVEQFKKDMEAPETAAVVTGEMKEAGEVGVRGTPSFFINGKQPAGRSFELYKSIIEEEIKNAKKG